MMLRQKLEIDYNCLLDVSDSQLPILDNPGILKLYQLKLITIEKALTLNINQQFLLSINTIYYHIGNPADLDSLYKITADQNLRDQQNNPFFIQIQTYLHLFEFFSHGKMQGIQLDYTLAINHSLKHPIIKKLIFDDLISISQILIANDIQLGVFKNPDIYAMLKAEILNIEELLKANNVVLISLLNEKTRKQLKNREKNFIDLQNKSIIDEDLNDLLLRFTKGEEITTQGVLWAIAEIRERKSYSVPITVLIDSFQLQEYLMILKKATPPLKEISVYYQVNHWISDIIEIKQDVAQMLYIDSLSLLNDYTIKEFLRIFPYSKAYIDDIRQHDIFSCGIFAVDSARHLLTVERYLPYQDKAKGLFGYINANLLPENNNAKVQICQLPLALIRNTQSRRVFNEISKRDNERDLAVNKRGETAKASVEKRFIEGENFGTLMALEKMRYYTMEFLLRNRNNLDKKIYPFTLNGFRDRMQLRNECINLLDNTLRSLTDKNLLQAENDISENISNDNFLNNKSKLIENKKSSEIFLESIDSKSVIPSIDIVHKNIDKMSIDVSNKSLNNNQNKNLIKINNFLQNQIKSLKESGCWSFLLYNSEKTNKKIAALKEFENSLSENSKEDLINQLEILKKQHNIRSHRLLSFWQNYRGDTQTVVQINACIADLKKYSNKISYEI